ncbi:hypothetical protein D3C85_1263290 [compost metagenome]
MAVGPPRLFVQLGTSSGFPLAVVLTEDSAAFTKGENAAPSTAVPAIVPVLLRKSRRASVEGISF